MSAVDEIGELVRDAAARVAPAVVSIGRHGRGSGFVVAENRVLTNAHNLRDTTTQVRFVDGRTAQGSVAGSDVDGDLVVLAVETGDTAPLAWSDREAQPGDIVIGVSAGRHQPRTTWGQVTAVNRSFHGPRGRPIAAALEHTAPAAPGSSGAPVVDAEGRVVAVNTHRPHPGFYLARTADTHLRDVVASLAEGHSVARLTLGVALAPAHVAARLRKAVGLPERDGLLVRAVVDGSVAAAAGIETGDLLVRAGDRVLAVADDLFAELAATTPGSELAIVLVRGADEHTVTATFPDGAPQGDG